MSKYQLRDQDWELISSYLDGRLPVKEKLDLEKRLNQEATLKAALEDQRLLLAAMRQLPKRRVPRHFTLTTAEARQAKRGSFLVPVFGYSSLLSAMILAVMFAGQFIFNTFSARSPMSAMQPTTAADMAAPESVAIEAFPTEAPMAAEARPVVLLNWGQPLSAPASGGTKAVDYGGMGGGPELVGGLGGGSGAGGASGEAHISELPAAAGGQMVYSGTPNLIDALDSGEEVELASGDPTTDIEGAPQFVLPGSPMPALILGIRGDELGQVLFTYPGEPAMEMAVEQAAMPEPEGDLSDMPVEHSETEAFAWFGTWQGRTALILAAFTLITGLAAIILKLKH